LLLPEGINDRNLGTLKNCLSVSKHFWIEEPGIFLIRRRKYFCSPINKKSGFGGLVVSMLASGTQDRGFASG
jgi:hypothetical protein